MAALSKSRFQLGLQCRKLLWLKAHEPQAADPITELQQHIFDTGTRVGELARERFGPSVLVAEDHLHSAQALATTARLMADPPSVLFEAAFVHADVFVRPDVLVRVGSEWDLYEVKSGTRVKPENLTDVAVQLWVLEGAGLRIRRAHLMHLDNTYVFPGGDYDLQRLFAAEDVTAEARAWQPAIPGLVREMLDMLEGPEPEQRIGAHCEKPYVCAFHGHCHASLPERPITALPRVTDELIASLLAAGITCIDDVPRFFPGLTAAQRGVCDTVRRGQASFGRGIAAALAGLRFPIHFLDFETMQSALPLYAGTRPWQQVPFQWSDHVLHEDGELEHREFLSAPGDDPRVAFADSLIGALGDGGSVVAYHASFEDSRLRELAEALPQHAQALGQVRARLFDLERPVRDHVRHPKLLGRTSIKVVLPALVEGLGYDELEIHEGGTASLRFLQCVSGAITGEERGRVLAALRDYCAMDTMAMVELYRVLLEKSGHRETSSRPA